MKILITVSLLLISTHAISQSDFSKLPVSTDSTYGYNHSNPLKMKKGNQHKSIGYSVSFLEHLQTSDNQKLRMVNHATVLNPNHPQPRAQMTNRYTGTPVTGQVGFLDLYHLVTSEKKDTLTIYVDIHSKGQLKIPKGLKAAKKN